MFLSQLITLFRSKQLEKMSETYGKAKHNLNCSRKMHFRNRLRLPYVVQSVTLCLPVLEQIHFSFKLSANFVCPQVYLFIFQISFSSFW